MTRRRTGTSFTSHKRLLNRGQKLFRLPLAILMHPPVRSFAMHQPLEYLIGPFSNYRHPHHLSSSVSIQAEHQRGVYEKRIPRIENIRQQKHYITLFVETKRKQFPKKKIKIQKFQKQNLQITFSGSTRWHGCYFHVEYPL